MTTAKQIKAARAEANRHAFGSAQWEAAMIVVRALVDAEMAATPAFVHTSRDGDVWSVA